MKFYSVIGMAFDTTKVRARYTEKLAECHRGVQSHTSLRGSEETRKDYEFAAIGSEFPPGF